MSIVRALLFSSDAATAQKFKLALDHLSISCDPCHDLTMASRLLDQAKYEAVIVDLELGALAGKVLDEVQLSRSNRMAVTIAIGGNVAENGEPLRAKTGFIIDRRCSVEAIRATLKSAYGLMLRERRRYFRCPTSTSVLVKRHGMQDVRCRSVNVSEGGMALTTFGPVHSGETVVVEFQIPRKSESLFRAESIISWENSDFTGLCFTCVSREDKSALEDWLCRKLEETLPDSVVAQFSSSD